MSTYPKKVYASVVYYNSLTVHGETALSKGLESLIEQEQFELGNNLFIRLCDNASDDNTFSFLKSLVHQKDLYLLQNQSNLGFCGAHNQAVTKFLQSSCDFFLFLNPDLSLDKQALFNLVETLDQDQEAGLACPRLNRGDKFLVPVQPLRLDSAGMYLSSSLRHFDRGSDTLDRGQYQNNEYVFGGTGACLLLKRKAVEDLIIKRTEYESDLFSVYPQLEEGSEKRAQLLDEAFFAYRDDADLAWRAQHKSWKCIYVASAHGVHKRVVLSTNRKETPEQLNSLSVKNRFLLQINNYSLFKYPLAFFNGVIFRNLIVLIAVLLVERSSIKGLIDLKTLAKRAFSVRKQFL